MSPNRDIVPSYSFYKDHFNNVENFSDSIIDNAFFGTFKYFSFLHSASNDQCIEIVSNDILSMVMRMAILENLYSAGESCRTGFDSVLSFDRAIDFWVGSMHQHPSYQEIWILT